MVSLQPPGAPDPSSNAVPITWPFALSAIAILAG